MQISPAISRERRTISAAGIGVLASSARAAASAYGPPDPIASTPSSGSMMSPVPERMKLLSLSVTASSASRRRRTRSLRQSLASSTAARRSEEHTSELQSQSNLVCRLLLEKKKNDEQMTPVQKA